MKEAKWLKRRIGSREISVLNLKHPEVERVILGDMLEGTSVFYDTRWEVTDWFCQYIESNAHLFQGKRILVPGAGVGMEVVLLSLYASEIYLNDYSTVALTLAEEQLRQNGQKGIQLFPGNYESIEWPEIDLIVGAFLVYNNSTAHSFSRLLEKTTVPVILANERLIPYKRMLEKLSCSTRILAEAEAEGEEIRQFR